jgi:hypothetical protein
LLVLSCGPQKAQKTQKENMVFDPLQSLMDILTADKAGTLENPQEQPMFDDPFVAIASADDQGFAGG